MPDSEALAVPDSEALAVPVVARRSVRSQRAEALFFGTLVILAFVVVSYLFFAWHHTSADEVPLPKTVQISAMHLPPVTVPAGFARRTLAIPSQHVSAPIDTVGVDATQNLVIPAAVSRVGWYDKGGPLDGKTGSVLVAGHVNYVGQGTGALGRIGFLHVGDAVITRGTGAPQGWRVTGLTSYLKSDGLPSAIFRSSGSRVLTLVTCGGTLDTKAGSYLSNIVLTAAPVQTIIAH